MATATATASVTDIRSVWAEQKYHVFGTIAIQASPATYASGGLTLSLFLPLIKASRTPLAVRIWGQSGYIYAYVAGVDASVGLIKVFVQDAVAGNPLAEMTNGTAIPAGLSGDTINFEAIYYGME